MEEINLLVPFTGDLLNRSYNQMDVPGILQANRGQNIVVSNLHGDSLLGKIMIADPVDAKCVAAVAVGERNRRESFVKAEIDSDLGFDLFHNPDSKQLMSLPGTVERLDESNSRGGP